MDVILHAVGGIGLFLFGMLTMTDALRLLAGAKLQQVLSRWTTSTLSGVGTGAFSTAILQSSSATTIAAVGFVSAGLLTFEQALGIVFGANLGTTVTGWMVATIGFKVDIGALALPLIFVGAVTRIVATGRLRATGQALAGFGLIFAGIEALQAGLAGLETSILPDVFTGDGLVATLALVGVGILVTVVTQSSSAGVAAALTAVHTDALSLSQAAAMVIGMDIGTTFSAFLATIGGSVMAARTGYAHVAYNLMTGIMALLLLTPFFHYWPILVEGTRLASPEFALVAFHSFFNLAGVVLVIPLAAQFAALLRKLVPDRQRNASLSRLDRCVLEDPQLAWPAIEQALREQVNAVTDACALALRGRTAVPVAKLERLDADINDLQRLCLHAGPGVSSTSMHRRVVDAMHIFDHLRRLLERHSAKEMLAPDALDDTTKTLFDRLEASVQTARDAVGKQPSREDIASLKALWRELDDDRHHLRTQIMRDTAAGELGAEVAEIRLDTCRWIRRNAYHLWRISAYLGPNRFEVEVETC
jgi:phosphate:Na+ symporter